MSRSDANKLASISVDQLVALNDEMAALVRLGIPLEEGLNELGEDMPGQLGKLAAHLGEQMKKGRSLTEILASDEKTFPPIWRAVVESGIRSGRLSAALEGMARTGRSVAQLRRSTATAMIYPLIVIALAYVALILALTHFIPHFRSAAEALRQTSDPLLDTLASVGQPAKWWFVLPPLAVGGLLIAWWYRSGRVMWSSNFAVRRGHRVPSARRWWTIGQSLRHGRAATFAELFALMHDHQVPTQEAIVLAADASGDRSLSKMAREVAMRIENGESISTKSELLKPLPPLLAWSIAGGISDPGLGRTLTSWADSYRLRAERHTEWIMAYLPIFASAFVGGFAVLVLALLVFGPLVRLLYLLGMPI